MDLNRPCGQLLYEDGEPIARCMVQRFTEHSHHDHTARAAAEAGLAIFVSPFERRALAGVLPAKEIAR